MRTTRLTGETMTVSQGKKWLDDVRASQPVTEVVCQAVKQRLEVVLHYLPLAAKKSQQDIAYVHQLRVSTRRAQSVLRLFADSLPRRRRSWWYRQLKRVRNAAGKARDLDVLIQRLEQRLAEGANGPLKGLVEGLKHQREEAQEPLQEIWERCKRDRIDAGCEV